MSEADIFRGDVATRLKNVNCPYCGDELKTKESNIEHVVGRRFVPKNSLDKSWNLILHSCFTCNAKKSDLENDISAITMQPDSFGRLAHNSPLLSAETERRATGAISRRTKRPVGKSNESISMQGKFGNASISINFTSPPQVGEQRAFELARMQLQGFFFLITYKAGIARGYQWPGGFHPVEYTVRSDWGNETQLAFSRAISEWDIRLLASPANEFFRVCIRKHPEAACWSWALEWNRNYRLIGFLGDESCAQQIVEEFPPEVRNQVRGNEGDVFYRVDVALDTKDDTMFEMPVVRSDSKLPILKPL